MEFVTIKDELDYSKRRYYLKKEIENIFVDEGYIQIEPSIFEEYDSFTAVNSGIIKKTMVKIVGGNGKVLILRPDITMNIIRSIIPRWKEGIKLKLFYYTTIYRNRVNSNIKEMKQIGIEYLGEDSLKADKGVIIMALEILNRYNSNFILEMGSSKYIEGLFNEIESKDVVEKLRQLIYKKNMPELQVYLELINIEEKIKRVLQNILSFQGDIIAVTELAKKYYMNKEMEKALEELEESVGAIKKTNFYSNIHLDLSMIAELGYYDGVIFKGYYPNCRHEIISGGRYDSLTSLFGRKVPAIGFSIDLDELMRIINEGGETHWSI